ncbi:MAG: hypothetical protein AAGA87_09450 [Pseudomonadota bacterium]
MKITQNTSDTLVVDNTPWIFAAILIAAVLFSTAMGFFVFAPLGEGLVFTLMPAIGGVLCFVFLVRRTQLVLDRRTDSAEVRRRTVFGYAVDEFRLSALQGATLYTEGAGKSRRYRVVLDVDGSERPFTMVYTGFGPKDAVDAINAWVGASPSRA